MDTPAWAHDSLLAADFARNRRAVFAVRCAWNMIVTGPVSVLKCNFDIRSASPATYFSARVFMAMRNMVKLDVAALERAAAV